MKIVSKMLKRLLQRRRTFLLIFLWPICRRIVLINGIHDDVKQKIIFYQTLNFNIKIDSNIFRYARLFIFERHNYAVYVFKSSAPVDNNYKCLNSQQL